MAYIQFYKRHTHTLIEVVAVHLFAGSDRTGQEKVGYGFPTLRQGSFKTPPRTLTALKLRLSYINRTSILPL